MRAPTVMSSSWSGLRPQMYRRWAAMKDVSSAMLAHHTPVRAKELKSCSSMVSAARRLSESAAASPPRMSS